LVLLEAMAAGLPVIALAEMGTRDILEAQRGAITPRAEPEAFGVALADFLNRPSAWTHLQQEAPEYAREWSDVAMAGRLAGLYQQLAGTKISTKSLSTVTA
jgi:glycosyltransferase involved in cell wall biosynthesis